MLDIKLIREHPEIVKANLEKRRDDEKKTWIDKLLHIDKEWRAIKSEVDGLRHERNDVSQQINKTKKDGGDIKPLLEKAKAIPKQIDDLEGKAALLQRKIRHYLMRLPNIMHESVPYGKDDTENQEIRKEGKINKPGFELKNHVELGENLGVLDFDRSAKTSGAGFYFLKGDLALLNQALIRFAIEFLVKRGYHYTEPPLMLNKDVYEGVTDLADFENVMYKIDGEDTYLIATSEHPLVSQFKDETFNAEELPIKLAGYSMCFRREIGSHGIDTKGLYRTHQFNKVEQVIICTPDQGWKLHEEILKNTEDMFNALEIPFRVVNICTGDLGIIAAKKYDVEAWFPRRQEYGEVASCSHYTDYQARRLNIKMLDKNNNRVVAHTLNNTGIATSRTLVAIMENFQNKDGTITIPKVLVPFMMGKTKIGGK